MLELSRRMTPARSSVGRIAGVYFDEDGENEGTFNINFLKLAVSERTKKLAAAKEILLGRSNEQLCEHRILQELRRPGGLWQLLDGIKESELKNDALNELFYELAAGKYQPQMPYTWMLYYGSYDVPVHGNDGAWLEGSEEIYTYVIAALCPLLADYEPDTPEYGFLYPAFKERGAAPAYVNIFEKNPKKPHTALNTWLLQP